MCAAEWFVAIAFWVLGAAVLTWELVSYWRRRR